MQMYILGEKLNRVWGPVAGRPESRLRPAQGELEWQVRKSAVKRGHVLGAELRRQPNWRPHTPP